jgi:hypothetical protein
MLSELKNFLSAVLLHYDLLENHQIYQKHFGQYTEPIDFWIINERLEELNDLLNDVDICPATYIHQIS